MITGTPAFFEGPFGLTRLASLAQRVHITDLKFADLLPEALARATLAERLADHPGAAAVAGRAIVERRKG